MCFYSCSLRSLNFECFLEVILGIWNVSEFLEVILTTGRVVIDVVANQIVKMNRLLFSVVPELSQ